MQCLTVLTENPKNICKEVVQLYLSELILLKTILMNNSNEKSLQRSFLTILNHILHHTILIPNVKKTFNLLLYTSININMFISLID